MYLNAWPQFIYAVQWCSPDNNIQYSHSLTAKHICVARTSATSHLQTQSLNTADTSRGLAHTHSHTHMARAHYEFQPHNLARKSF